MELVLEDTWNDGSGEKFRIYSKGRTGNQELLIESDKNSKGERREVKIKGSMDSYPGIIDYLTISQSESGLLYLGLYSNDSISNKVISSNNKVIVWLKQQ